MTLCVAFLDRSSPGADRGVPLIHVWVDSQAIRERSNPSRPSRSAWIDGRIRAGIHVLKLERWRYARVPFYRVVFVVVVVDGHESNSFQFPEQGPAVGRIMYLATLLW
jgi:hypothetical protein